MPETHLDPDLASAIKRARGSHAASDELRRRIEAMAECSQQDSPLRMSSAKPAQPVLRWVLRGAIAASLLLAGGMLQHLRHEHQEEAEYAQANANMLTAMVTAHSLLLGSDAQPVKDVTFPQVVQFDLSYHLNRPLPLPALNGYTITSAAVTPFQGAIAGRVDFMRDQKRVTLISLPLFAFAGAHDGQTYDVIVNGHPITGFVDRSGVHCLVGDASMPLAELTALRKQLQRS